MDFAAEHLEFEEAWLEEAAHGEDMCAAYGDVSQPHESESATDDDRR